MKIDIYQPIKDHGSFGIMVMASLSIFILNIFLREVLTSVEYGVYSIVLTFISIQNSFGLLGFEQVFMRLSEITGDKITIPRGVNLLMLFSGILMGVISTLILLSIYIFPQVENGWVFLFIPTYISISLYIFSFYRLRSQFVMAQIVIHLWKFILLILIGIFLFKGWPIQNAIFNLWPAVAGILILGGIFIIKVKILPKTFEKAPDSQTIKLGLGFLISLLCMTYIGYFDRFIIESKVGIEELGEYFYYANLFIFPFALFQNYVGFKQLIEYKNKFNLNIMIKGISKAFWSGLLFGIILLLAYWLISFLEIVTQLDIYANLNLIIVFLLIGITRLMYSIVSASLGAVTDLKTLQRINLWSLLVIGLLSTFFLFIEIVSPTYVALLFLALWASRFGITLYGVKLQMKNLDSI